MSKIGKKPVAIPSGVTVSFANHTMSVKGPKGELHQTTVEGVEVAIVENEANVTVPTTDMWKYRGLYRTLLANMIEGVTKGYEKKLQLLGVGYNAVLKGKDLELTIGYSHKVDVKTPAIITVAVEKDPKGNSIITCTSIDKQAVGEFASKVRALRKPEPYKGKGIRYFGEFVKLKPGKAAK